MRQIRFQLFFSICAVLTLINTTRAAADIQGDWVDLRRDETRAWSDGLRAMDAQIGQDAWIVIGEQHYTPPVQAAEAEMIRALKPARVAWEFLNFAEQESVDNQMTLLRAGVVELAHFFEGIPSTQKDTNIRAYLPVVDAARAVGARLVALNAPREIKKKLRSEGFDSLPPEYRPHAFDPAHFGSDSYWDRFKASMDGHVSPDALAGFYLAQCYTDDIMADTLAKTSPPEGRTVIIAGSFHTDFRLGTVSRMAPYGGPITSFLIKLVSSREMTAEDRAELFRPDLRDGFVSDVLGFVQ